MQFAQLFGAGVERGVVVGQRGEFLQGAGHGGAVQVADQPADDRQAQQPGIDLEPEILAPQAKDEGGHAQLLA